MKDLFIETIEGLDLPIFLQGSMTDEAVCLASYFTFWNNSTDGGLYYDNADTVTHWDFSLNFYSIDPALVNVKLLEARALLRKQGFIINGKGYDVASDEATHTGRGINVLKIEDN